MVLNRKDAIVLTTINIIDECGLQGVSTREIARRVGISEGTIFKHFKSKNEIIHAVLDQFTKFDDDIIQTIILRKLPAKEAIIFLIGCYAEYYEHYPAITAIPEIYNELANNSELTSKVKQIYIKRLETIQRIITEGQRNGVISTEICCESLSDVIFGLLRAICLKWRFTGRNFSLKEHTILTLKMILKSYVNE